mmetsp:Transcript_15625/g.33034  ORF Transcript_15625/g.33034 Transcript_15625/m.33034 type:complete len:82 (+) Transcript_15625:2620-2865(+)
MLLDGFLHLIVEIFEEGIDVLEPSGHGDMLKDFVVIVTYYFRFSLFVFVWFHSPTSPVASSIQGSSKSKELMLQSSVILQM